MADVMDTLKNILGPNAEDKIQNVVNSISAQEGNEAQGLDTDSLEGIMQIKKIMESMTNDRNNPRTNLLLSLKPYMRGSRKQSIDSAVRFLGLANLTKLLRK